MIKLSRATQPQASDLHVCVSNWTLTESESETREKLIAFETEGASRSSHRVDRDKINLKTLDSQSTVNTQTRTTVSQFREGGRRLCAAAAAAVESSSQSVERRRVKTTNDGQPEVKVDKSKNICDICVEIILIYFNDKKIYTQQHISTTIFVKQWTNTHHARPSREFKLS